MAECIKSNCRDEWDTYVNMCLNCKTKWMGKAVYCPGCGDKLTYGHDKTFTPWHDEPINRYEIEKV